MEKMAERQSNLTSTVQRHSLHEASSPINSSGMRDRRPAAVAQCALKQGIANSSAMQAQRDFHAGVGASPRMTAQRRLQAAANSPPEGGGVVQGRFMFDNGTIISARDQLSNTGITFVNLDAPIASAQTWMVHNQADMVTLDGGTAVEVLTPHRHIIGETHHLSNFNAMKAKWPRAAAMEEGVHRVEEANLQLPASQAASSHNIFNTIAHEIGGAVAPLENFHAANMVRLAIFLSQWNEQEATKPTPFDWITNANRRRLIPEAASIANQYAILAVGVYTRGMENRKWWQIDPRFATAVETEYNQLYQMVRGARALRALTLLDGFRTNVNTGTSPTPTQQEYNDVQWYVRQLLKPVENILVISAGLGSNDNDVLTGARTFGAYLDNNAATMRDADVGNILNTGNPAREKYMANHINGLSRPGLVKVGSAHIAGLQQLAPADALYYNNGGTFDAATQKVPADL
jgi:hypothetical protein